MRILASSVGRLLSACSPLFAAPPAGGAATEVRFVAPPPPTSVAAALQAQLDAVGAAGGGTLILPPGEWRLDQPVHLRSGVALQLEPGTRIAGDLRGESVRDVALRGAGPGQSFVENARFVGCSGVAVSALSGERQWYTESTGVRVDRVTLAQAPQRQAEGSVIGFTSCRDVRVADCDLASNDDVFCLKRAGEDIHLTRSILRGHLAAPFKIGTETDGLFRNITFTDSVILDSDRAAITIESVDGAIVEDVVCERIRMVNVNTPLFIRLGNRDRYCLGRVGRIRRIVLRDIESVGGGKDEGFGSAISGIPGHPVEDVLLERVRIVVAGGGRPEDSADPIPERPEFYPEFDMFGPLPAYGLYARHVQGLVLRDVSIGFAVPDRRPALVCDRVQRLVLERFDPAGLSATAGVIERRGGRVRYLPDVMPPPGAASIRLINTSGVQVDGSLPSPGVAFLEVTGAQSTFPQVRGLRSAGNVPPLLRAWPEVPGMTPDGFVREVVPLPRVLPEAPSLPPGDGAWLARAIAEAKPGSTLVVPPGHYVVGAAHLPLRVSASGVTLRPAAGPGSVRIEAAPPEGSDMQRIFRTLRPPELARYALFAIAADDVTLEGLTLGRAYFNVFAHGARRVTLRGNTFDFSRLFHVYLIDGSGHRLTGNRARASLNCVARFDDCNDMVLEQNHLAENPAGFRLVRSSGNLIRRNRLIGLSWDAILLDDGSNDNLIEGNTIHGGRLTGVQIRGSHRARLLSNRISAHKTEAVLVDRGSSEARLEGNHFEGNRGFTISNETPHPIDARGNWWGTPDGPSLDGHGPGERIDRGVEAGQWLRSAPGGAGAL
jgi:parallel beta-helix repeat protein